MRDFICAIAFPYCVGICPRGNKEGRRGRQRVERKQRDLARSERREVAIRIVGTGFEKTEGGDVASAVRENRRGIVVQ